MFRRLGFALVLLVAGGPAGAQLVPNAQQQFFGPTGVRSRFVKSHDIAY